MFALYTMVRKSKLGKSMRAVAADKSTAALMGIDVNGVISQTFIISGMLAGAAGVMWGLHNGLVYYYVGFLPGIKAFTSAVLGGIGNIPGAMLGGMLLGMIESIGPTALGISYQLKDVLAFVILIIILIFRPSGILGEVSLGGKGMNTKLVSPSLKRGLTFGIVMIIFVLIDLDVMVATMLSKLFGANVIRGAYRMWVLWFCS